MPRLADLLAMLFVGLMASAVPAQQLRSNIDQKIHPTEVRAQMEEVEETLRAGKWKNGLRRASSLTEVVLQRTWYGKELRQIVADLALYQALAEANLGRRDDAIWHWHVAQNLDSTLRRRDLAPYGKAAKLLYEFPLRAAGEVPAGFVMPERLPSGPRLHGPVRPKMSSVPTVLNNTGAAIEGSGNFQVEVIIDQRGKVRQPVVKSTHLHPIVIYASLEWLRDLPPFVPARFEGKTVDSLDSVTVQFRVSRW